MTDDANELSPLSPKQQDVFTKFIDRAKKLVEWIDSAPDAESFVAPILIGALAARQEIDGEGISEEEINKIGKWLERRYIDIMILSGVARGHFGMRWDDDTNEPAFCLTPRGKEVAKTHDQEST